jgi:transcriptional regulator with XRE-family HTH domain
LESSEGGVHEVTDTRTNETIGARLKRLRLERGLSQRQLAGPGVSYAYISRIEAEARTPSVKALRVLARKLHVSVEYLETGRDSDEADERELRLADAELKLRLDLEAGEAEGELRALAAEAEEAGDRLVGSRARLVLGLAAAQRGSYLDAVELLETALGEHRVSPHAQPDVYGTLGQAYAILGAADRAVQLFDACLEEVTREAPDDVHVQIRFATYLSYALTDAGEYVRARDVIRDALRRANTKADPYTRVRLYWSVARLAGLSGRTREALTYIRRAIALLETTEDTVHLARAYLLATGVEISEEELGAAKGHLERAERLLGPSPEQLDLGMLRIAQARMAVAEEEPARGAALAREAIAVLGDYHGGEQGDAVWTLAKALAQQGDSVGAGDAYRRAIDLLALHGRPNEAATASREWAEVLEQLGRAQEAVAVRAEAESLGATTGGLRVQRRRAVTH